MAEIRIDGQIIDIAECTLGGDHQTLLINTLKTIVDNDLIVSRGATCPKCKKDIIVCRNRYTGIVSTSLAEVTLAGFVRKNL
jgi:hypothetical protein